MHFGITVSTNRYGGAHVHIDGFDTLVATLRPLRGGALRRLHRCSSKPWAERGKRVLRCIQSPSRRSVLEKTSERPTPFNIKPRIRSQTAFSVFCFPSILGQQLHHSCIQHHRTFSSVFNSDCGVLKSLLHAIISMHLEGQRGFSFFTLSDIV